MKRFYLPSVLTGCVVAMLLPTVAHAFACQPIFYHTSSLWLEKWFSGAYAFEQDRAVDVYSDYPTIATSALIARLQSANSLWFSGSGFATPPNFTFQACPKPTFPLPQKASFVLFLTSHPEYIAAGGTEGALATTNATFNPNDGNVRAVHVLIDGSSQVAPWVQSCSSGCPSNNISLYGVLVHEWGHALRLDHPTDTPGTCKNSSVMDAQGTVLGSAGQEQLYLNDQIKMSQLYQGFPVLAGLSFNVYAGEAGDTLRWSETTSRFCLYRLYVSDACLGPYTPIGQIIGVTAQSAYSFVSPAVYARKYYYRLRVEQNGAVVDSSRAASTRTLGAPANVPGAPTSLTADGARVGGGVALSWQASSGVVDGYYIYRSLTSLPDCLDGDRVLGAATGTSMLDATAQVGEAYAYRVRAFNSTGSSVVSEEVRVDVSDVTPPATVVDLSVSSSCTSLNVSWTAPGDYGLTGTAHGYDLRMSTSSITSANFAAATQIATGTPGAPGTHETVDVYLGACSGRRYFALRSADVAGNTSAVSDVPFGGTPCVEFCGDGFAPVPAGKLAFALATPSPTPTSGPTNLGFSVPDRLASQPLELSVFDPLGRPIRTFGDVRQAGVGLHALTWDLRDATGRAVPNGVYFVRLKVGTQTLRRTILVMR